MPALWDRVGGELRAVLSDVEVGEKLRCQVLEFLEVNELGLAFQTLVAALADARADLGPSVLDRLAVAAREMASRMIRIGVV
jgi:hypothetical protein